MYVATYIIYARMVQYSTIDVVLHVHVQNKSSFLLQLNMCTHALQKKFFSSLITKCRLCRNNGH